MLTIIIICIIISSKCLKQTARVWRIVLKTEVGEVGKGQIMKSFTEPKTAMEDHCRIL